MVSENIQNVEKLMMHRHIDIDYKSSLGLRSNDLTIGTIKENLVYFILRFLL